MKKFSIHYEGKRKTKNYGGEFYKENPRCLVIEYDYETISEYQMSKLSSILAKIEFELEAKPTIPDLGRVIIPVDDKEDYWVVRDEFRRIEKSLKYYDPEYDRFVSEDEIKRQYNNFSFCINKDYTQFRDDNFEKM